MLTVTPRPESHPMRSAVLFLIAVYPVAARAADPPGIEHFEKHVRPVLVEKCLSCHAGEKPKGGLRLDTREALLQGGRGGAVVVPGKPKESRLVAAIRHTDEDLKMPPAGKLPDREIAALEKWVELGAPWPEKVTLAPPDAIAKAAASHWAFKPVERPPVAEEANPTEPNRPLRPREARVTTELSLSPRADKRTLIRRATFDLHGLPPTPEEVEAFVKDDSPDAYEKLIDRLLASPALRRALGPALARRRPLRRHQGLRLLRGQGVPVGVDLSRLRHPAFNDDMPFDRFVHGATRRRPALPGRQRRRWPRSGFLTLGGHFMNNTHDIIDDRIDVVTRGLMGLTVTCARCHDHKFDPIPTRRLLLALRRLPQFAPSRPCRRCSARRRTTRRAPALRRGTGDPREEARRLRDREAHAAS